MFTRSSGMRKADVVVDLSLVFMLANLMPPGCWVNNRNACTYLFGPRVVGV